MIVQMNSDEWESPVTIDDPFNQDPKEIEFWIEFDPNIYFQLIGEDIPWEFQADWTTSRRFHLLEWRDVMHRLQSTIEPIPIDKIKLDPNYNTRRYSNADLNELKSSILTDGLTKPIVIKKKDGKYLIR